MARVNKASDDNKKATKQAKGVSPISGVAPPKHTQFGQPGGNPRHNGAWKKENTPRGKLEKLLSETTLGEFLEQIQENTDTNLDANLGDVLISCRLHNVIKKDPDDSTGKVTIDSNEMDKLLYFVYGSKSENDMNLKAEDGVPLIKGFVIPVLPDNAVVIPDEGADGQPDA